MNYINNSQESGTNLIQSLKSKDFQRKLVTLLIPLLIFNFIFSFIFSSEEETIWMPPKDHVSVQIKAQLFTPFQRGRRVTLVDGNNRIIIPLAFLSHTIKENEEFLTQESTQEEIALYIDKKDISQIYQYDHLNIYPELDSPIKYQEQGVEDVSF